MTIEGEKKPYQPTEGEIKKAEGLMDRVDELMSDYREKDIKEAGNIEQQKELIQKMKNGELKLELETLSPEIASLAHCKPFSFLSGKIGEHQIKIKKPDSPKSYEERFEGFIDDEKISEEYAKEIWDKYIHVGRLQQKRSIAHLEQAVRRRDMENMIRREKERKAKNAEFIRAEDEEKKRRLKGDKEKYKL